MLDLAKRYTEDVLSGRQVAGRLVKLAVERNLREYELSLNDPAYPFYFDAEAAQRVVNFAEICRHWKGAKAKNGERIRLEPHQVFYFSTLWGWKERETGLRRFRSSYKQVARKNAKTTENAINGLYHISMDGEEGAQCYVGATKEAQATILVNDAGQIVKKTPELRPIFTMREKMGSIHRVICNRTNGFIAPLGRDSKTQDGFDPSMGIMDEYHEHPTTALMDIIETGMVARDQPAINAITTAGFNKASPCFQLRKTCVEVLEGVKHDDTLFILIYELDEEDDEEDEEVWIKANPNMGASVNMANLRTQKIKAWNEGGQKIVSFKTKNLNMWTDAPTVWIKDADWMRCAGEVAVNVNWNWFGGIDLASTGDFTAFSLISEPDGVGVTHILWWFWLPEEKLAEREKKDRNAYRQWIDKGIIRVTPGNVTDYSWIKRDVMEVYRQFPNLKVSGFDKWNAYSTITDLQDAGMEWVEVPQNIQAMSEPTKLFERDVLGQTCRHGGNPVARWMMGNVVPYYDPNDNIKIRKGEQREKVDGIVATVDAYAARKWWNENNQGDVGIVII